MSEVTQLLRDWSAGRQEARDELLRLVYDPLRAIAERHLYREREGHTLQPTALVHELYLRLVDQRSVEWHDRMHFFAVAAQVMRRILVDHARRRKSEKRGGGRVAGDDRRGARRRRRRELRRGRARRRAGGAGEGLSRSRPGSSSCASTAA